MLNRQEFVLQERIEIPYLRNRVSVEQTLAEALASLGAMGIGVSEEESNGSGVPERIILKSPLTVYQMQLAFRITVGYRCPELFYLTGGHIQSLS